MTATRVDQADATHQRFATPGIVEGLELRVGSGPRHPAAAPIVVIVHPGVAVTADGDVVAVTRPVEINLSGSVSALDGPGLDLLVIGGSPSGPRSGSHAGSAPILDEATLPVELGVQLRGGTVGPGSVRIATITRTARADVRITPIFAGLGGRRLAIGSPGSAHLVVEEGETVVGGTLSVARGGATATSDDGCLVVGSAHGDNIRVDRRGLAARDAGRPAELQVQPDGGDTRFGGPIEGPERDPLNIVGGSDLSLGGGGVLMLGRSTGPNLVLDENEILARDAGRAVPLVLQWDGGETRFGGPLRGPAGGPLRVTGGSDLSLGGHGVLLIGEDDGHHLVLDDNEIMAGNGTGTAELYLQWQGGGTLFGGPVGGGPGGELAVQVDGGVTRFGGPIRLAPASPSGSAGTAERWDLQVVDGQLELRHNGRPVGWMGAGGEVVRCDRETLGEAEPFDDALAVVRRLRPVSHRPTARQAGERAAPERAAAERASPERHSSDAVEVENGHAIGLVAEEVAEIAPDLVAHAADGSLGVRTLDLAVLALAAVAEQQRIIDRLERIVAELSGFS